MTPAALEDGPDGGFARVSASAPGQPENGHRRIAYKFVQYPLPPVDEAGIKRGATLLRTARGEEIEALADYYGAKDPEEDF